MFIKLTKLESEILRHRLDVPECIADAIGSTDPADNLYHPEDVEVVADALRRGLTPKGIDTAAADDINDAIAGDVLVECIEGSTYCGSMIDVGAEARYNAACRAMESLAEKIGNAIGRKIEPQLI